MTTGTDTTSRTRLADLPADDPMIAYLTGSTGFFSSAADPRFSYCLYVPRGYRATGERLPLLVSVHGAGRDAERARDVFAGFAEEYRCVIMAPLLPMTASDLGSIHNYKQISYSGIRFDHAVLNMVAEVGEVWGLDVDRFLLFGFSAGGQFVHRFAYLHPDRLAALSVGAPGRITRPDLSVPWPDGLGGTAELTAAPDLVALRAVPVQLVVGECDTKISLTAGSAPADPGASRNRVENARLLHGDLTRGGVTAELAEVAGVGHHMLQVIPEVQEFFARQIRR